MRGACPKCPHSCSITPSSYSSISTSSLPRIYISLPPATWLVPISPIALSPSVGRLSVLQKIGSGSNLNFGSILRMRCIPFRSYPESQTAPRYAVRNSARRPSRRRHSNPGRYPLRRYLIHGLPSHIKARFLDRLYIPPSHYCAPQNPSLRPLESCLLIAREHAASSMSSKALAACSCRPRR